jgi:hypothetical protein
MLIRVKAVGIPALTLLACLTPSACRSAFIQTAIVNHAGGPVRLVEVDYPNASFGTQQIAPGATFNYRFKVQDSGPVTVTFTGSSGKMYTSTGPSLHEGQQGRLTITLAPDDKVTWTPEL